MGESGGTAGAATRPRKGLERGDAWLLFTAFCWGATYPVAKPLVTQLDPAFFSAMRYLTVAALLFAWLAITGRSAAVARRDILPLLGLGLLGFTVFQGVWGFALQLTTAAKASILIATSPIFGALLASRRGERLSPAGWAGVLLAFLGVAFVVAGGGRASLGDGALVGDLLFLACAFAWALFTTTSAPVAARLGPVLTTAWSALFGSVLLLPLGAPATLAQDWSALPPSLAWNFLFLSIVSGAAAHLTYYAGIGRLGVARAMAYLYLTPVFATVVAVLALGESLAWAQAAGAFAVLAGVALARTGISR